MRHLSPEDVIDVLDGCAQDQVARHAESCRDCRVLVDDARHATGLAATDELPEPSPLFWTQFSKQVGEAVRRAPEPARSWVGLFWGWRALPVASVVVLAVLVGVTQWQGRHDPRLAGAELASAPPVGQVELLALPADDEPWSLVSQVMADIAADETSAAAMPESIGSADRALESLSESEKGELTRLLKAEIGGPGVSP